MKIVLDVKNTPIKNDLLIFNGKEWECVSKDKVLDLLRNEVKDLQKEVLELKQENDKFKLAVNEKLKEYHNILQLLTKEE